MHFEDFSSVFGHRKYDDMMYQLLYPEDCDASQARLFLEYKGLIRALSENRQVDTLLDIQLALNELLRITETSIRKGLEIINRKAANAGLLNQIGGSAHEH